MCIFGTFKTGKFGIFINDPEINHDSQDFLKAKMLTMFTEASDGTVRVNSSQAINCSDNREKEDKEKSRKKGENPGKLASQITAYPWAENHFP